MNKRSSVQPGDIFAVQLSERMFAVGIVLHVSTFFPGSMMIGFYDLFFSSVEDISIEKLGGEFIDTPNYTDRRLISKGPWVALGNSPELLRQSKVPNLRVAYTLLYKDQVLRQLSADELREYTAVIGQGGLAVEDRLREHFSGRVPDSETSHHLDV